MRIEKEKAGKRTDDGEESESKIETEKKIILMVTRKGEIA